jgi:hypothetical protein
MSDTAAYMALALGLHALHSGLSQTEYGKQMDLSQDSISLRMRAAKVADTTPVVNGDGDLWRFRLAGASGSMARFFCDFADLLVPELRRRR